MGNLDRTFETERLHLRFFTEDDAADVFDYAKSDKIGPMAGWKPHATIEDSRGALKYFMGGSTLAIVPKDCGRVKGTMSLMTESRPEREADFEIGYVLAESHWGRGLAAEAAWPVIEYAFEEKGAKAVNAGHFSSNTQSRRVIEKLGFRFVKVVEKAFTLYDGQVLDEVLYRMTKEDYLAIKASRSSL